MKDRIVDYLREAGGEADLEEVLRHCGGMVGEAPRIQERLARWIAQDPRFECRGRRLGLLEEAEEPDALPLEEATFVVVDLETTGTARTAEITEMGAVRLRQGLIEDTWTTLVDPGAPVPGRITRLTGIHDGMLEGQPSIAEALPEFLRFARGSVLVAHNAPFDLRFLQRARRELQGRGLEHRVLCTVRLARSLLPRLRSYSLDAVTSHLGIVVEGRHRALGDALATARLLRKLLEHATARGEGRIGDLARYGGVS